MEKDFGELLKERRRQLELTQKQLAQAAGISDAYICCIEKGTKLPPADRICRRLELSLHLPEGALVKLAHRQRTDPDILVQMDLEKTKRSFEHRLDRRIAATYQKYWEIMLHGLLDQSDQGPTSDQIKDINRRFRETLGAEIKQSLSQVPRVHRHEFTALGEEILQRWTERYQGLSQTLNDAVSGQGVAGQQIIRLDDQTSDVLTSDQVFIGDQRPIPVINDVSAGYPRMQTDLDMPVGFADNYIYDPTVKSPNAFALTVCGDSMEPRFHEGDVVVIDPSASVVGGDFCFVRFAAEGEMTFKQVFFDTPDTVRLQPLNNKYPPQICGRDQIDVIYKVCRRIETL